MALVTRVISLPSSLDAITSAAFSKAVQDIELGDECILDFSAVGNTEPFGMLLVSAELQRLIQEHPDTRFQARNFSSVRYAAHMGFFKAFGLDFGKSPGEAVGNSNYIPLKLFDCNELEKQAIARGTYVGDEVEAESQKLAEVLSRSDKGEIFDTLTFSLREIMRNVVEHSGAKQFGVCAQFYPSKHKVELAIVDRGMGLRESLKTNPHLDLIDDKCAINYALQPGISGKSYKGARKNRNGHWGNSGFGLYMTTRLCRNGGSFFVTSGSHGMFLGQGKRYLETAFRGTAVRMIFDTTKIRNLTGSLETFRKEGNEIAKLYEDITRIDPSSASLMLSRDFDKSIWSIFKGGRK